MTMEGAILISYFAQRDQRDHVSNQPYFVLVRSMIFFSFGDSSFSTVCFIRLFFSCCALFSVRELLGWLHV